MNAFAEKIIKSLIPGPRTEEGLSNEDFLAAEWPFFHPLSSDEPDLCYVGVGHIRYQTDFTLLFGQTVRFCRPSTGWINPAVEYVLFNLLGTQVVVWKETNKQPYRRFNIAVNGMPGPGVQALHPESARYIFRADSIMGFLGGKCEYSSVMVDEVESLIRADRLSDHRDSFRPLPADGSLPLTPIFLRRVKEYIPQFTRFLFDVERGEWGFFEPLVGPSPVFLPFAKPDAVFDANKVRLENELAAEFPWAEDIYVTTGNMHVHNSDLAIIPPAEELGQERRRILERRLQTPVTYGELVNSKVFPDLLLVPRAAGDVKTRQDRTRSHYNTYGLRSWNHQLVSS